MRVQNTLLSLFVSASILFGGPALVAYGYDNNVDKHESNDSFKVLVAGALEGQEKLYLDAKASERQALLEESSEKIQAEEARLQYRANLESVVTWTDRVDELSNEQLEWLNEDTCSVDEGDYPNGRHPKTALCELDDYPGHYLRPTTARNFLALAKAFEADFGRKLEITDSYRTYDSQVSLKARKPELAARPGTSNHGWGLAIDFASNIDKFDSKEHKWMQENAELYGFYHPKWAQANGSKPEAWHWESFSTLDSNLVQP